MEVEFDKATGYNTSSDYSLPRRAEPFDGYMPGVTVTNMTVDTNIGENVLTLSKYTGLEGKLEWWPYNYGNNSSGNYSHDDTPDTTIGYGSFQVHANDGSKWETMLAWNGHTQTTQDVGIGHNNNNNPLPYNNLYDSNIYTDWTHALNHDQITNFKLQISMVYSP